MKKHDLSIEKARGMKKKTLGGKEKERMRERG